jgi:hypothetical protein
MRLHRTFTTVTDLCYRLPPSLTDSQRLFKVEEEKDLTRRFQTAGLSSASSVLSSV